MGEKGGEGGRSLPSANPDNVAAGGATDARCGEGEEGGGEGRGGMKQITAHSNPCSSFSLSFFPLCIRRGFDEKIPHVAVQHKIPVRISTVHNKGIRLMKGMNDFIRFIIKSVLAVRVLILCALKGHGNEADFLGILQKLVPRRSLTLPFEPF